MEEHALLAIGARVKAGSPVFSFQACKTRETTTVLMVTITRKEPFFQCSLSLAGGPDTIKSWTYPEPIPGYRVEGCEPLLPGPPYHISVLGDGRGASAFVIHDNGDIEMVGSGCKYEEPVRHSGGSR